MGKDIVAVEPPLDGKKSLYEAGLTLIHPFYGEVDRFKQLYHDSWVKYNPEIKKNLRIILADDCGEPPIHKAVQSEVKDKDLNISVYRIKKNLRYNTAGALNLGCTMAETDFILMMDNDCTFLPDDMHKVMQLKPSDGWLYKFRKNRITSDPHLKANTRYLPCTNLLHKNVFNTIGGFDEDFTGEYSGGYGYFDCHFDHKLIHQFGFNRGCVLGIIATEYMNDIVPGKESNTSDRLANIKKTERSKEHMVINRKLYRAKQKDPKLNNYNILRFEWEKVYATV